LFLSIIREMAKVGEGDPRWIVSERDDGNNVNQWHWDQKDKTKDSHERLKSVFEDRVLYGSEEFRIITTKLASFEGDVTLANRKGKMRCFFDLKFSVNWKATSVADGEVLAEGKFVVDDCDSQNYVEDFRVVVTGERKNGNMHSSIMEAAKGCATKEIRQCIKSLIDEDLLKGASQTSKTSATLQTKDCAQPSSPNVAAKSSSTRCLTSTRVWFARKSDIYECFTLQDKVQAITRSRCDIEPVQGGKFRMLNDFITGEFLELQANSIIKMKWRLANWNPEEGNDSIVSMQIGGEDGKVTIAFEHRGIPADKFDQVAKGWDINFWGPMKSILGYGHE